MNKNQRKSLLFKNLIRQNIKNWVQTILIISLITISSLLFMLVLLSNETLQNAKNKTISESNIHDFVVNFNDAKINSQINSSFDNEKYYENALEDAANLKTQTFNNEFIWDRVESKNSYLNKGKSNQIFLDLVTDNENARVDKLVITKGYNIGKYPNTKIPASNQVVLEPTFAKNHNIGIGSIIRLTPDDMGTDIKVNNGMSSIPPGYNWFQVVGYGVSADYETPILNNQTIIPNKVNQGLVYVNPEQFGLTSTLTQFNNGDRYWNYNLSNDKWANLSTNDENIYYVGKFTNGSEKNVNLISEYLKQSYNIKFNSSDTISQFNKNNSVSNLLTNFFNQNTIQLKIKQILSDSNILNNESNFKKYLLSWITKKANITWDNRWNINIYNKVNNNYNSIDYSQINPNIKTFEIEISQNLLNGETNKTNQFNFMINNPFYNEKNNSNILKYNIVSDEALASLEDALKNHKLTNISSNYLSIGNTDNYFYLKEQIISNILDDINNKYFSNELNIIQQYLYDNLMVSLSTENFNLANSINISNPGLLELKLNNNDFKNISTNIELNNNKFNYFQDPSNPKNPFIYKLGDPEYDFNSRTNDLKIGLEIFNLLTGIILLIVLTISAIILFMIVKKNIFYMKKQFGLLKSLGYTSSSLVWSYIALPVYLIIISILIAFPLVILSEFILNNIISQYFDLIITKINYSFLFLVFGINIIFLFIFLTTISITACYSILSKPIRNLLYHDNNEKKYAFIERLKKPYAKTSIKVRFNIAMLLKSLDKLVLLSGTLLLTILIFSFVITLPNIINNYKDYSFIDDNYNSIVEYNTPIYNSPYSFMKTYNPDSDSEIPTEIGSSSKYINALTDPYEKNLSANYYAPSPESAGSVATELTNIDNIIFTKDFLNKMDSLHSESSTALCEESWGDYSKIANVWLNYQNNNIENIYNTFREFYIQYKNTISLSINPRYLKSNTINDNTNPNNFDFSLLGTDLTNSFPSMDKINLSDFNIQNNKIDSNTLNNGLTIYKDNDFLNYNYTDLHLLKKDAEINSYIKDFNTLFAGVFFGRLSESIVQAIYHNAPNELQSDMKHNIQNPRSQFNLSFNVIPYDPSTDDLGLMFNANYENKQQFNVFGVSKTSNKNNLFNLKNIKNSSINDLLNNNKENNDGSYNIIINESLAKKLNWKQGQEYNLSTYIKQLNYKNHPITLDGSGEYNFNSSQIFTNSNGDFRENNYSKMQLSNLNDPNTNNYLYESIDENDPSDANYSKYPTSIEKNLTSGNMSLIDNAKTINVKVISIDRSYGEPTAYINNQNALNILNYNKSQDFLFNMFKQEWENVSSDSIKNIDFTSLKNYKTYEELLNSSLTSSNAKILVTMFNNEYPIFNYKVSENKSLLDYTSNVSITNQYGDYSRLALQGGTGYINLNSDKELNWSNYSEPTVNFLITKQLEINAMNTVESKIIWILSLFFILAFLIILIIILTVSDIIFYENKKVILTMKTLGYNNFNITKSIFGFYIILAILLFAIGSPLSFLFIKMIITQSKLLTPVIFNWKNPILLIFILSLAFSVIFIINFRNIKKIDLKKINHYE